MPSLISKVSSAAAACARRVSRATRRLLRGRRGRLNFSQLLPIDDHQDASDAAGGEGDGEEGGLWRRAILMGKRCKPLDFPGAIHYDSFGRLLPAAPSQRGGKAAGALLCRSACDVDEAVITAHSKARPPAKHV